MLTNGDGLFCYLNDLVVRLKKYTLFITGDKYDEGSELLVIDGQGNEDRTDIHQESKLLCDS